MTEIFYKCGRHGYQKVARILFPDLHFELDCGCIYSANLHGSWYRLKTHRCDRCDEPIKDTCMAVFGYMTKYYHIECAKGLGNIENGKIVDINKYPENQYG